MFYDFENSSYALQGYIYLIKNKDRLLFIYYN